MKIDGKFSNKLKKRDGYFEIEMDSWSEYLEFLKSQDFPLDSYLYRGQRDPSWDLKPSFFRHVQNELDVDKLKSLHDEQLLKFFKENSRGMHNLPYDKYDVQANDDWIALGQHYGLYTRFLDWVKSPYVAAFFSFIKEDKKVLRRAIYIFDNKNLSIRPVNILTHENKRVANQRGVLISIDDGFKFKTLEDRLSDLLKKGDVDNDRTYLLKITIPADERKNILNELSLMNINYLTLFPDLTGASLHANFLFEQLKERI